MSMVVRHLMSAVTALVVAGLPGPATAAEPDPTLTTYFDQVTVAPGSEGGYASLLGFVPQNATSPRARRVAYKVDYSAVAAFATIVALDVEQNVAIMGASASPGVSPCTGTGPILTCTTLLEPGGFVVPMGYFQVLPTPAAQVGDTGTVVITTRLDGGPAATTQSQVRIGEGVDLATSGTDALRVPPGGTVSYRPEVSNVGTKTVEGVVLYFSVEPDWLAGTSFTNCTYGDSVVCTFDTELAPGETYGLSEPVDLRAPDDAAAGSWTQGGPQWLTPAVWEDWRATFTGLKIGKPGTKTALDLLPLASVAGTPQVDEDNSNQTGGFSLTVSGAHRPDIAAVGARVAGAVGARVPVRIGLVNRGPGTLYPGLFVNNQIMVTVDVPRGLTVVATAAHCTSAAAEVDRTSYYCWIQPEPVPPGRSVLFDFTFAVTDDFDGEAGRIEVKPDLLAEAPLENGRSVADNTAKLLITVPGDNLPITGTRLGLAAVALLAVGAAGLLLARRRRVRFTA